MTPKSREVTVRSFPWKEWITGDTVKSGNHTARVAEKLITSSGHDFRQLGKTNRDIGGDFRVQKNYYNEWVDPPLTGLGNTALGTVFTSTSNPSVGSYHYNGKFYARSANVTPSLFPSAPTSSAVTMDALGTSAIAKVIPTNPLFDLATFIGELREGLPRMLGSDFGKGRIQDLHKSAGNEFLNLQFGIKPVVNDFKKAGHALINSNEEIEKYIRNSGKRLKRRYDYPTIESVTVTNEGSKNPDPVTYTNIHLSGRYFGPRTKTQTIKIERWFSGCFTYYLPNDVRNGLEGFLPLANKLFGVRLTPETLWNLTPWSWLADWFSNMGDVLHNVQAFRSDGLVMPYGYMMERVTITDLYSLSNIGFQTYPKFNGVFNQSFTTVVKQRRTANPFGFGVLPGSLNPRQWAILGALGITRSNRQF